MITRIGGTNRYSNIVVYDRNVYLSGVVPLITCDISGSTLYEQTSEVLSIIDKNLQAVGTSKAFILSMTIYLVDETMYEEMNRAFDEWMASTPNCAPARATIGNVKFPNPRWKIEIVCNAAIPKTHTSHSYGDVNYVV